MPRILDLHEAKVEATTTDKNDLVFDAKQIQTIVFLAAAANYFDLPGLCDKVKGCLSKALQDSPASSFAILEACTLLGPAAPNQVADLAWRHVRCSSECVGTTNTVACLSEKTLEKILQDQLEMNEFELFTLLLSWVESSPHDRKPLAMQMIPLIQLEGIDPQHLSSSIESSGLVSSDQLLEAYQKQALTAQHEHSISFQKKRHVPLPSWSNSLSQDCTSSNQAEEIGLLQCSPITSGMYQWTSLTLGSDARKDLLFGVASKGVSLSLEQGWLGEGAWGFLTNGLSVSEGNFAGGITEFTGLQPGDKVTLTLDLCPNRGGNGMLSGTIQKKNEEKLAFPPIKNLLDHLDTHPGGFVPAVEIFGAEGFELLSFKKVHD